MSDERKRLTESEREKILETGVNPSMIVSFEDFEAWWMLKNSELIQKDKRKVSDGTLVNLKLLRNQFLAAIDHLPAIEKNKLLKIKVAFEKEYGKMSAYWNKACGKQNNPRGNVKEEKKSIEKYSSLILDMFGKYFSEKEVREYLFKNYKLTISHQVLRNYYVDNVETIKAKQELFKSDFDKVRLGHKRSRLEELSWLYRESKKKYQAGNQNREEGKYMLSILKSIKEETEGNNLNVNFNGRLDLNVEANINIHVKRELLKTMNLSSIIISRIALRSKQNPLVLLNQIQKSYYSKFINLNGDDIETLDWDELELPSTQTTDLNAIRENLAQKDENDKIKNAELDRELSGSELEFPGLKQRLLDILGEKIGTLKRENDRIDSLSLDKDKEGGGVRVKKKNKINL